MSDPGTTYHMLEVTAPGLVSHCPPDFPSCVAFDYLTAPTHANDPKSPASTQVLLAHAQDLCATFALHSRSRSGRQQGKVGSSVCLLMMLQLYQRYPLVYEPRSYKLYE